MGDGAHLARVASRIVDAGCVLLFGWYRFRQAAGHRQGQGSERAFGSCRVGAFRAQVPRRENIS
eukprot:9701039-Lingulodinium_polyedra.AAC.1